MRPGIQNRLEDYGRNVKKDTSITVVNYQHNWVLKIFFS